MRPAALLLSFACGAFACGLAFWPLPAPAAARPAGLARIDHIVVVYLENHSFDNMFGLFPGADGLLGGPFIAQTDRQGHVYDHLPPVIDTTARPAAIDPRFPDNLPNRPFSLDSFMALSDKTGDLRHRFYQNQLQIDGGRNDRFVAESDAGALTMGFYDTRKTRLFALARKYTLADHYFMGAFGGSFLNHMFLVCACAPRFENAPLSLKAVLDDRGRLVRDGSVTPDGFAVNTVWSKVAPHGPVKDPSLLLPAVTAPNIGDALSDKGVDWAWYSGGWNDAVAGHPDESFQFHHQPFAYFARYGEGTEGRKRHLKDEADLIAAIDDKSLPSVAFFKPLGAENQHPGYADVASGDARAAELIEKIEASPLFASTLIIVTYDENGGFWDHVAPPKGDRWGPGTRVPAILISPWSKGGRVDHHVYDTASILRLIETRFGLAPLGQRDRTAGDLRRALNFDQD